MSPFCSIVEGRSRFFAVVVTGDVSRHGLKEQGVVGPQTVVRLDRWRDQSRDLAEIRVLVALDGAGSRRSELTARC